MPDFQYEKIFWKEGFKLIGGCDEVGRGSFAGPVVAGCVVFSPNSDIRFPLFDKKIIITINDSKKLTPYKREIADEWIKKNAFCWGIGKVNASLINQIGIGKATKIAFRLAVKNANIKILKNKSNLDFLLIDAFYIPFLKGLRRKNQKAIIKGDEKSISIAAASIIAKVYRDSLMKKIGSRGRYEKYDWVKNKGYGTKKHCEAIIRYGICKYHRRDFVNSYIAKRKI